MGSVSELAAHHQFWTKEMGGIESIFNRPVPFLAVAGCTDLVDPREGKQSSNISHLEVQKAGKRSAIFFKPVISEYFRILADQS